MSKFRDPQSGRFVAFRLSNGTAGLRVTSGRTRPEHVTTSTSTRGDPRRSPHAIVPVAILHHPSSEGRSCPKKRTGGFRSVCSCEILCG